MNLISTLDIDNSPRILLGNTVNHLMITVPTQRHSATLAAFSHRKLWLARPGDLIVAHNKPSPAFRDYALGLLGIDGGSVRIANVSEELKPLAELIGASNVEKKIREFVRGHGKVNLHYYALDQATWRFARDLGINLLEYKEFPAQTLVSLISDLNSKEGFRQLACQLGLPIAPGVVCKGFDDLLKVAHDVLSEHGAIILKLSRSSNAYGNLILKMPMSNAQLRERLHSWRELFSDQPEWYIVEEYKHFIRTPSIEMLVCEAGPSVTYVCDQRFRDRSFTGMVTQPSFEDDGIASALNEAALHLGEYLYDIGYRGVVDLDAGVTAEGELFYTETNVRRTAGTFVHELVCRLSGHTSRYPAWISDSMTSRPGVDFADRLKKLWESSLAFSHDRTSGVIFLADTLAHDNRLRYLVLSPDVNEAEDLERRLWLELT